MKYIGQKTSDKFIPTYLGSGTIISKIEEKRPETLRVDLIEWCYSLDELNEREGDWTDALGLWPLTYNLKRGGNQGGKYSDESRKKMSESHRGIPAWNKGMTRLPDRYCKVCNKKLSNKYANTTDYCLYCHYKYHSKPCSEEKKEKIRQSNIGKNAGKIPTKETLEKRIAGIKKVRSSEESRMKTSIANTGKHWYTNGNKDYFTKQCPDGCWKGKSFGKKHSKRSVA